MLAYLLKDCMSHLNKIGMWIIKRDSKAAGSVRLLLIAVLLAGCAPEAATPSAIPSDVGVIDLPTYTVQRGDVVDSISFAGRVLPLIQEYLVVPAGGRIGTLY